VGGKRDAVASVSNNGTIERFVDRHARPEWMNSVAGHRRADVAGKTEKEGRH
jgi:hypothetical protein